MCHLSKMLLRLDKPFELKSLSTEEHISQDGGYVSNCASVWDRSDSGDFAVSSLSSCVKSLRDNYCHRDQQETESGTSDSKTFEVNEESSGTADPSNNVFMSSDYVPCKALEFNGYDPLSLNKDLKNDLQNRMNINDLDSSVDVNTNSGGYVSHLSALNFSGN